MNEIHLFSLAFLFPPANLLHEDEKVQKQFSFLFFNTQYLNNPQESFFDFHFLNRTFLFFKISTMYALNKTQLIGFVTEKPEVRETSNGAAVTDLNLEVKSFVSTDQGMKPMTTFMNVTLWRKLAEIAGQYVQKGSEVYVSGRLETDSWEDESGNKKYRTRMIADDMILLTPKDGGASPLPESLMIFGGINKAEVLGNTTKDAELKTTPNGSSVTTFSVATSRQWKDAGGETQEKTEFHNIVAWGELAEQVAKHVAKGRKVYVSGRVQTRSWEAPDGQKRYTTEIVAEEVKSLGHSYAGGGNTGYTADRDSQVLETPKESKVAQAINNIPEISYESEIKPEDLPF